MSVENLFGDETHSNAKPIHIRIQSRNGRKCISSISGLENDLDLRKICKFLKKNFRCNGSIIHDEECGQVIILQGDHREKIKQFLIATDICTNTNIIIHGF